MKRNDTFFWYDLETFGLNPRHDRIAQFAGVRTDENLSVIEDPVILYCRLSDDYLPDPLACMITGITPQEVAEKGLVESEFIAKINAIFSEPGTCAVGYNTIRFDDEFIRNALFRNFLDPYKREYDKGNSRWDILDLVRAAHDLRPKGIEWPKKADSGRPSFKLTDLTGANDITHENAHDAMSDVWATLELARLIKWRQPKLFSYYLTLRKKQTVKSLLCVPMGEPVVLTAAPFTRAEGCTTVVMPITASAQNSNSIVVFDLMQDPSALISASHAYGELEAVKQSEDAFRVSAQQVRRAIHSGEGIDLAMQQAAEHLTEAADMLANIPRLVSASDQLLRVKGINRIALNRVPFISPMSVLSDEVAVRLGIDRNLCEENRKKLLNQPLLAVNVRKAADADEYTSVDDVDFSLYSGDFFGEADAKRFAEIRSTEGAQLWNKRFTFDDSRCHEMLWRYICRNWPETLDPEQQGRWKSFCAQRLIQPPGDTPVTLEFYARKIAERMASKETEPKDKEILGKLAEYGKQVCERVGLSYPR